MFRLTFLCKAPGRPGAPGGPGGGGGAPKENRMVKIISILHNDYVLRFANQNCKANPMV